MGTLRLLEAVAGKERHDGEVYSCAYTPDGAFVLTGGWDGYLRLWDAETGSPRMSLAASPRPLSCCACSPDGQQWLSGSMEGLLSIWDGVSQQSLTSFVAHTRPISGICFSPDGQLFATSSWDRAVTARKVGREREGRSLMGHQDIVAGCRFTLDGQYLVSWSHDRSIKIWDLTLGREHVTLNGHVDRVTALALSPDGRYALSGGRDQTIRLWDLDSYTEIATVNIGAEVRACFYLLDAESIVVVDAAGRIFLMSVPSFQVQIQVQTPFRIMCGALAPSGRQITLGGEDGLIHRVAVEGFENASLVVTPLASMKPQASILDRFFGTTRLTKTYSYTCPACRQPIESTTLPTQPVACPRCRQRLRINARVPVLQGR